MIDTPSLGGKITTTVFRSPFTEFYVSLEKYINCFPFTKATNRFFRILI